MRNFLNDYMNTLTSRQRERVATVLQEATVAKEQFESLLARISAFPQFSPVVFFDEGFQDRINGAKLLTDYRDAHLRLSELYAVTNLVSLLLNSNETLLSSDVKSLEDELISLEKSIENYAFLMSDSGAYTYAFMEPFSDARNQEFPFWLIPDRDNTTFSPSQYGVIKPDEGVLVLPTHLAAPQPGQDFGDLSGQRPLTVSVISSNSLAYATSDTGLDNMVTRVATTGWRTTVGAAGPINAPLTIDASRSAGAQVLLEFRLAQSAPCTQIEIIPFAEKGQEILKLTVYDGDTDGEGQEILSAKRALDRTISLNFPMRSISRFRILLNQPTYSRVASVDTAEDRYAQLVSEFKQKTEAQTKTRQAILANIIKLLWQNDVLQSEISNSIMRVSGSPQAALSLVFMKAMHKKSPDGLRMDEAERSAIDLMVNNSSAFSDLVRREVARFENLSTSDTSAVDPVFVSPPGTPTPTTQGYAYQYALGLQSVSAGTDLLTFKGVFVSKPLVDAGDVGELRLKAADQNVAVTNMDRDSPLVTSIEYAVSSKALPVSEEDWLPVMPVGTASVEAERFFPDSSGKGFFRFVADRLMTIDLYKNGYKLAYDTANLIASTNQQGVAGLRLPIGQYSSDDIFTVSYTPNSDYSIVSFENEGFSNASLITSYDTQGAGEGYSGTADRDTVTLVHTPYIDDAQVSTSTYIDMAGMTPYQPILVRLEDGTVPLNLTNYSSTTQSILPTSSNYYYIHSGDMLIFNQSVRQDFRVYYSYLQNSIRVRTILRANDKHFVSPKVDFYQVKAKVRLPNLKKTV